MNGFYSGYLTRDNKWLLQWLPEFTVGDAVGRGEGTLVGPDGAALGGLGTLEVGAQVGRGSVGENVGGWVGMHVTEKKDTVGSCVGCGSVGELDGENVSVGRAVGIRLGGDVTTVPPVTAVVPPHEPTLQRITCGQKLYGDRINKTHQKGFKL